MLRPRVLFASYDLFCFCLNYVIVLLNKKRG
nr:MAG TPA: hypothetical protein [Caudoviricetes sp.]